MYDFGFLGLIENKRQAGKQFDQIKLLDEGIVDSQYHSRLQFLKEGKEVGGYYIRDVDLENLGDMISAFAASFKMDADNLWSFCGPGREFCFTAPRTMCINLRHDIVEYLNRRKNC